MNLWEKLLDYARKHPVMRSPIAHMDLWEASEQVQLLTIVVQKLTEELELLRGSTTTEIDRLRMKVEVLEAHKERTRSHG